MGLPILGIPSRYHIWKVVMRGTPKNADDVMVTKSELPSVTTVAGPFMRRREARKAKREIVQQMQLSRSSYKEGFDDEAAARADRLFRYGPGNE